MEIMSAIPFGVLELGLLMFACVRAKALSLHTLSTNGNLHTINFVFLRPGTNLAVVP